MANKYWVGNGGNWSDAANHWSDSDGGSPGATKPGTGDDVYFNAASFSSNSQTVTLDEAANCASMSWADIDQTVTLSSSVYVLNVYGSLTLHATNLTWTFTGTAYVNFLATSTGWNITTNGMTPSMNRIYFLGSGGGWSLADNANFASSAIYLSRGTFNTNDKSLTITANWYINDLNAGVTLNLGSSVIHVNGFQANNASTYTVDAGTSYIHSAGGESYGFVGRGKTYYDVEVNVGARISENNTFHNLLVNAPSVVATTHVWLDGNQTISGTLTISGADASRLRLLVCSYTLGTARTLTCNGSITASNVDFRDITGAGSASWDLSAITGLSGDCGGNSGITFTTAVPQYYFHTSGACNWSDAKWYTATNGGGSAGRVPLPQDDVYFDANSFSGTSTLTVNCPRIGKSLDMSGVDSAVTFSMSNNTETYGSLVFGSNITRSGNYTMAMYGRTTYNFNSYEKTFYAVSFNSSSGFYTNLSNINVTNSFNNSAGTFDVNDFDVNAGSFSNFGTAYLGNGTITCTSISSTSFFNSYGTIYCEQSTIKLSPASGSNITTPTFGTQTYHKIWFSGSGTGSFDFNSAVSYNTTVAQLVIDAGKTVRFRAGIITTVTSSFTAVGTNGNLITITSITSSTHTLDFDGAGKVECNYLDLSYSSATPSSTWYAGRNSTNNGNNTGWLFYNYGKYWVGNGGNWSDTAHWSDSPGGTSGATAPTSADDVYIEASSFDTTGTISLDAAANCASLDFTGLDQAITLSSAVYVLNIYESLTLPASNLTWTFTGTAYVNFKATSTGFGITSNGMTAAMNRVYFDGSGGGWTNQDNWTITGDMYLTNGTWDLNSKTITLTAFYTAAGTKTITFGSTSFNCSSWNNNANTGLTLNEDTGTITSTWDFLGGGNTYYNVVLTRNGTMSLTGANTFTNLTRTGQAGISIMNIHATQIITGTLTLTGNNSSNYRLLVCSDTLGTSRTITCNGTVVASNVDFRDITASGTPPEMINNGAFADSTNWTVGTDWSIGSGVASYDGSGSTFLRQQDSAFTLPLKTNTTYTFGYDITSGSNSDWYVYNYTGEDYFETHITSGTGTGYTVDFTTGATIHGGGIAFLAANFVFSLDNVSLKEKNPWNLASITGGSGDCGGNTGITFTTAVPQFYYHTSGACNWSDAKWYTETNGGGSVGRVPLPQDNATFDANSFSGTSTLTVNCPRIGKSLDMSGVDAAVTFSLSNNIESYGSYVLGNNITQSGNYNTSLMGRSNYNLNTYEKTIYYLYILTTGTNTYTNLSNLSCGSLVSQSGVFDLNDFNCTCTSQFANYGTCYFGNGTLTLSSTSGNVFTNTYGTVYAEGSTIKFTPASGSNTINATFGTKTFNKVWFSGSHTGYFDINQNLDYNTTFSEFVVDAGRKIRFRAGITTTITSAFTAVGTAGNLITINSVTAAAHYLDFDGAGDISCDYLDLSYSNATPVDTWYAGTHSNNTIGNSGWIFTDAPSSATSFNAKLIKFTIG